MTARFEDWPRVRVADGVLLSDPRGAAAGLVRIRRARAPRTLRAVLAEACACPGARLDAATAEVQAVVTDAAEHGVIARLRAAPGVTCEPDRLIAIVHGERAQIQLEGCCAAPAEAAGFERAFEALVRGTVTGEPPLRRRLFGYQPPRGWHGVRRACATVWLPPGCPREPGALAVYDATPVAATAARRTHALLAGPPAGAGEPIVVGPWRDATIWRGADATIVRCRDARFEYELRLDHGGDPGRHGDAFDGVLRSVTPVPSPARAEATATSDAEFAWAI